LPEEPYPYPPPVRQHVAPHGSGFEGARGRPRSDYAVSDAPPAQGWPRSIAVGTGLGATSSSCSYVAVALARSLFRKGADFSAAMAFQFASTNLVFELGIIMVVILGWQFTLGEFVGGPLMIVFVAIIFRLFLSGSSSTRHVSRPTEVSSGRWRGTPTWTCPLAGRGSGGSG
jgi:uncharacterized membrane protein YraQ (UPF0718 family)